MDSLKVQGYFNTLRDLRDDMLDPEAAEALEFAISLYNKHLPKKDFQEYILYRNEEYVATGTLTELAELVGVKRETMRFYSSRSNLERIKEIKNRGYIDRPVKFYHAVKVWETYDEE